jgi:hypothetical protein
MESFTRAMVVQGASCSWELPNGEATETVTLVAREAPLLRFRLAATTPPPSTPAAEAGGGTRA